MAGLDRFEDFPGAYSEFQADGAVGASALQLRWLRNDKGVRLRLCSNRAGVMLEVSATGVAIAFE